MRDHENLISNVPEKFALLLTGPPGVGKMEFCLELSRYYIEKDENVIFVTVDAHPQSIRQRATDFGLIIERVEGTQFVFVDCYSAIVGQEAMETPTRSILYVNSLSNIEQIGMNIMRASDWLGSQTKVIFYSVSPLFLHNSMQSMAKFFQIVSSTIRTKYGFILFVVHEGVHDESTSNTLKMLVDGVMEMRFEEDLKREIRVHHMRGLSVDTKWIPFEIEAGELVLDSESKRIEQRLTEVRMDDSA
ncbi:MAG: RAD55 family ATPase [Thermoplasmata archaeon]